MFVVVFNSAKFKEYITILQLGLFYYHFIIDAK